VIKSRRMKWAGHIAHRGGEECLQSYGQEAQMETTRRLRCRREVNIKMDLREMGIDEANWIHMAQDRVQ